MRGLLPLLLLVPAAIAAACATTTPIQESMGGSTTTGSSGTLGQDPDAGPRSCGVAADDPGCNTCLEARCCAPAQDCANEANCLTCLGMQVATENCTLDHAFQTLRTCLDERCASPCGLSTSSSSSSGGGTSSSSTSSTSSTSTSSTSSTSTSSTSSTSSAGSTSSSTSSSSTSSSSGGPTSCDSVDGAVGCCDSQGNNYFCDSVMQIVEQPCPGGSVCGWDPGNGWYDCVAPPGGPDPSSTYPLACGF